MRGRTGAAVGLALVAALTGVSAPPPAAAADAVESFYAGKTIQLLIGYSAGGGYDSYGRLVARHFGDHLPGHPSVVPQNMPGAGSLRVVNYLYNVAPKDGTVIATFSRGMAMDPLLGLDTGVQFQAQKLGWLGSVTNEVSVCAFRADAGIRDWHDMLTKPYTLGGTGSGADTDVFPNVLRNLFHARAKLVNGYPGGQDVQLALERGEIAGRCGWSWSSLVSRSKPMLDDGTITIPVQIGLAKHEGMPQVPLILDLTEDPKQLEVLRLIVSRQAMARPYAAPPGVPAARFAALRAAFDATLRDPAFLDEARKSDLEVRPVSGAEIDNLLTKLYATPPEVVKLASQALQDAK